VSDSRPLSGVRVLDLTRLLPGGYCTQLLADLGAEVIKVEQPGRGDDVRSTPPFTPSGVSAPHLVLGRGKRSITLDLKQAEGADLFRRLVTGSDVVVESFRPGVLERLGLGRADLLALAPRLVYASITAYGRDGPYAQRPGHDINAQAYAGALSLGEGPADGPARPYLQASDMAAGLQTALGIVAALFARGQSGQGQAVDVAMTDAVSSLLAIATAAVVGTGQAPPAADHLTGALACYGTYRCSDGRWLAVGALEPKFFTELCELVGRPELARRQYDEQGQDELRAELAAVFATRSMAEWTHLLAPADTCVAPVLDHAEALSDANARDRGAVLDLVLSDGSTVPVVAPVARLSRTPARAGTRAPGLGEDTVELLVELGVSESDVTALRSRGVL